MTKKTPAELVSVVRLLRHQMGLSMEAVAQAIGTRYLTILNIEHGKDVSFGTAKALASFLGISLDCLIRNDISAASSRLAKPSVTLEVQKQGLRDRLRSREIVGDCGEQEVVQLERKRLAGTPYAEAVSAFPSTDTAAGYDVQSFQRNGCPLFIEVKSTSSPNANDAFFITQSELDFMQRCMNLGQSDSYQIHRVFNIAGAENGKCCVKVISPEDFYRDYVLIPVTYKAVKRVKR